MISETPVKTAFASLLLFFCFSMDGSLFAATQSDLNCYSEKEDDFLCIDEPTYRHTAIQEKENLVNDLISHTRKTPENELTSEESLALRKTLVDNLKELTALYELESEEGFHAKDYHRASFQLHAFLAEWKALDAKSKLDRDLPSEAIKSAETAIKSRHKAAETADLLGWHEEAPRQRSYIRWPESLLRQAKEALRHEIASLETLSRNIQDQINALGETGAYTAQGILTRKNLIKLMVHTEEKLSQVGDIQQAQELIFRRLTTEAELSVIQAKRLLDLGLSHEALLAAEKSIEKRNDASRQASILGWTQDAILQQEFTSWPSVLAERAKAHIQTK